MLSNVLVGKKTTLHAMICSVLQSVHLDSAQLVKAVDKLSGKLQAMNRLLPAAGLER